MRPMYPTRSCKKKNVVPKGSDSTFIKIVIFQSIIPDYLELIVQDQTDIIFFASPGLAFTLHCGYNWDQP